MPPVLPILFLLRLTRPLVLLLALSTCGCARDAVPAGSVNTEAADAFQQVDAASLDAAPVDAHLPGADARSCESARAELKAACGFSESWIAGLSCQFRPSCVLGCFTLVTRCDDVGCAFCETCDCGTATPFATCVLACP